MPKASAHGSRAWKIIHGLILGLAWLGLDATRGSAELSLVDRIVAVVNDEPVLLSDVEQAIAIDLDRPEGGAQPLDTAVQRRRALDRLIDQRLRLREVERFTTRPVPAAEVDTHVAALAQRHGSDWPAHLEAVGLDEEALRHLIRRQLRVLDYIEERLAPRVRIAPDEIQAYYRGTLRDTLEAAGEPIPPLDDVRAAIRQVLHERQLNLEIERWTAALRTGATIIDQLDTPIHALPPLVRRIER